MSARSIEFIFQLIDKFTPAAARLAQAAQSSMQSITKMGAAANAAEASINRMAAGQEKVARSFQTSARSVREAERANQLYFQSQARIEKQQIAMMERHQAKQGLIQSGMLPGPQQRGMSIHERASAAMMGYAGVYMAGAIGRAFSHFLDPAESEAMGRIKMGMVGFKDGHLMAEAEAAARAMTKKYKNLSRGEIYEMLHDGVAIHGTAHESIANIEQQAKLMSFMEAWEGGKHKGTAGSTFREVQAWIKSMEMKGVLNETDPVKRQRMIDDYVQAGMAIKVAYPSSQLRLTDMLLMQKRAGTAWYNLSEEFRFGYAPAMAQERGGQIVGTALMSAFASIRGGKKLSHAELGAMKSLGLLDNKSGRWTDAFQKEWADNPFTAAQDIANRIAKKKGLDPKNEKHREVLANELTKGFSWLFPNRTASTQFLDLVFNNENFRKHAEYMALVRKEMKEMEEAAKSGKMFYARTKEGAEHGVGAQMKNFGAAIGAPMREPYIARLNNMAATLNRASESTKAFFDAHPTLAKMAGHGIVSAAGALALVSMGAGVGMIFKSIGFGLSGLGLGGGAVRVAAGGAMGGPVGAAAATALMALPLLARTSPAHLATAGKAAADASHKMVAGMSAAGKAAEAAATGGFLGKLARFGLWGGLAAGAGILAYSNRDSLAGFGSGAMEFGRRAALFRLFSSETSDMLNNLFKEMKFDVPKLDFSSIQKAIETIAAALVKATERLRSHIAFQLGLRSFKEHYGENGENIPEWATPAERAKIMGKIMADRHAEMFNDSAAEAVGVPWLSRMNHANFYAQPGFGQEVMEWGKLPGSGSAIPQAEAQREISVKTAVEGTVNGSVKVEITGTVNGPVNGNGTASVTGAVQGSSNASRGESSPAVLPPTGN